MSQVTPRYPVARPALEFAPDSPAALPLVILHAEELEGWLAGQSAAVQAWLRAQDLGEAQNGPLPFPGTDGLPAGAVALLPPAKQRRRTRFWLAGLRGKLPPGDWRLVAPFSGERHEEEALGWLLEGYRFTRYKDAAPPAARLVAPAEIDARRIGILAASEALARDLINTPASDMGPAELEAAVRDVAAEFGAPVQVTQGEPLETGFPMIHAVGKGSPRDPRLIELTWGTDGPLLTLVGKGVCFDTGGLDIKPPSSMGLMKKDMGGAATTLALARSIMALGLPIRLRLLIAAVENSVSGAAFRPQDILASRKGLTVEINNTDAEGRLVLGDALALADEATPELIVSMATLTGAARVAVGSDLAPFFATLDHDAEILSRVSGTVADPVWRMPFHEPYEAMIEPGIADLDNAPSGGMGGSITAALFLRRFVTRCPRYVHFDIHGWQLAPAPARPKGGAGQGWRTLLAALPELLEL